MTTVFLDMSENLNVSFSYQVKVQSFVLYQIRKHHKGLGGIRLTKSSNIEMLSEDLFVSERRVEVTYKFRNKSKKKVTTIVAFPLPDIPDLVDSRYHIPDSDSPNYVGFKAFVDGNEIKLKIENRVLYDGRDITELLDQLRFRTRSGIRYRSLQWIQRPCFCW